VDLKQAISAYGVNAVLEFIDVMEIANGNATPEYWREYCLRHKLITRNTKIVRVYKADKRKETHYYKNGKFGLYEPQNVYWLYLRNGSGKTIIFISFTEQEYKEWQNETNPNHAEPS
jgi:hypothetical protein